MLTRADNGGGPEASMGAPPARVEEPKIETRSSRGLEDVWKFLPAGVAAMDSVVAARPTGALSSSPSPKSSKFSACWPATSVCRAFCLTVSSSVLWCYVRHGVA